MLARRFVVVVVLELQMTRLRHEEPIQKMSPAVAAVVVVVVADPELEPRPVLGLKRQPYMPSPTPLASGIKSQLKTEISISSLYCFSTLI